MKVFVTVFNLNHNCIINYHKILKYNSYFSILLFFNVFMSNLINLAEYKSIR